jgi:hypothetical protein
MEADGSAFKIGRGHPYFIKPFDPILLAPQVEDMLVQIFEGDDSHDRTQPIELTRSGGNDALL